MLFRLRLRAFRLLAEIEVNRWPEAANRLAIFRRLEPPALVLDVDQIGIDDRMTPIGVGLSNREQFGRSRIAFRDLRIGQQQNPFRARRAGRFFQKDDDAIG